MSRAVITGVAALVVAAGGAASAQTLARRVAAAPDGTVRLSFASRPGVCGNGRGTISTHCVDGRCDDRTVSSGDVDDGSVLYGCEPGPVRLSLAVRGGHVTRLRAFVGGDWRPADAGAGVTDLGSVPAPEAARYLLNIATSTDGHVAEEAIFPATLADSVTIWPDLMGLARNDKAPEQARRSAVFWLGQAAGDAATRGLDSLATDAAVDRDVRESAVFALSQQPNNVGVSSLIKIARTNHDPELRRRAIFWLGQSDDPRALTLFEDLLTKP